MHPARHLSNDFTGIGRGYALTARTSRPLGRFTRVIANEGRRERLTGWRCTDRLNLVGRGRLTMSLFGCEGQLPPRYAARVPSLFGAVGRTGASPASRRLLL
jgi:hypothetical protein